MYNFFRGILYLLHPVILQESGLLGKRVCTSSKINSYLSSKFSLSHILPRLLANTTKKHLKTTLQHFLNCSQLLILTRCQLYTVVLKKQKSKSFSSPNSPLRDDCESVSPQNDILTLFPQKRKPDKCK